MKVVPYDINKQDGHTISILFMQNINKIGQIHYKDAISCRILYIKKRHTHHKRLFHVGYQ